MKVYLATLVVMDFEGTREEEIVEMLERTKHLHPSVIDIKSAEIENWNDDHPLNQDATFQSEVDKLFKL